MTASLTNVAAPPRDHHDDRRRHLIDQLRCLLPSSSVINFDLSTTATQTDRLEISVAVGLFFDVHVDHAIAAQLRLRHVDVLTAQEDAVGHLSDEALLEHASRLGRPIVTHDIRFQAMAESWQAQGRPFCGLVFAHQMRVSIGQCVRDLELIAKATDPPDWSSAVIRLPL